MPLTEQKILDAEADLEDIGSIVNGDENTDVPTRYGGLVPTIRKVLKGILAAPPAGWLAMFATAPELKGATGDPGGNVMAIGLKNVAEGLNVPAATGIVQSSGYSLAGRGHAIYVHDATLDGAFMAAHPRATFTALDGRRFRLSHDQDINVKMFGATGDGATDDSAAIIAAVAYLKAVAEDRGSPYYEASPRLRVPFGHYYMGATTLELNHTMVIEGEGVGGAGAVYPSLLRWAAGATGIRTHRHDTTGATDVIATARRGGDDCIIRGLHIQGGYAGVEGEFHGIQMRSRATIEDCIVTDWQGDGIHATASTGTGAPLEGNVNLAVINRVSCTRNRRGLFWDGADVNACTIIALDCSGNRTWGIDDSSFLGNTYIGCHLSGNGWDGALGSIPTAATFNGRRYAPKLGADALWSTTQPSGDETDNAAWLYLQPGGVYNGVVPWVNGTVFRAGGAFKTDNANAANIFLGCYTEGDQNIAQCDGTTQVIGGLQGANVYGAAYQSAASSAQRFRGVRVHDKNSNGIQIYRATPSAPYGILDFDAPDGKNYGFQGWGKSIFFTLLNSLVNSNWWIEFLLDGTTNPVGQRKVNFPNGFGLSDKKVLSAAAAPASGTYVQGDMVFNSAPAAGGPMGWMCVAGGSPGTWKAMGNLAA